MRMLTFAVLVCISSVTMAQEIFVPPMVAAPRSVVSGPVVVRDTIKANNRDATSYGTTEELNSSLYAGYLVAGNYSGTICQSGYEFQLTGINQAATIDSAFLYIYIGSNYAGTGDTLWHQVYDVDNAAVFNAADGHALTSHATVWTGGSAYLTGVAAHPYDTYKITVTSLVQHVVDRAGWTSGNYIGFVGVKGTTITGDEFWCIWNYEGGNASRTPRMVVYAH